MVDNSGGVLIKDGYWIDRAVCEEAIRCVESYTQDIHGCSGVYEDLRGNRSVPVPAERKIKPNGVLPQASGRRHDNWQPAVTALYSFQRERSANADMLCVDAGTDQDCFPIWHPVYCV